MVNPRSKLTIATRKSPLALWQANYVANQIKEFLPALTIEIKGLSTSGDEKLEISLSKIGGKGLFTKELEQALLSGAADLAVHSMKDLPVDAIPELTITAVCRRDDPRDVLISPKYLHWQALPAGAKVGTSSLRRKMQLTMLRPDLEIVPLRGNIQTRLAKVHHGDFDAIILAAAGLTRMQLDQEIQYYFPIEEMLPAVGQGIIGIQIRTQDQTLAQALQPLNCRDSWQCLLAERSLSQKLGASCDMPLAVYAKLVKDELYVQAKLGSIDGKELIQSQIVLPVAQAAKAGEQLAEKLFELGAKQLLMAFHKRID